MVVESADMKPQIQKANHGLLSIGGFLTIAGLGTTFQIVQVNCTSLSCLKIKLFTIHLIGVWLIT